MCDIKLLLASPPEASIAANDVSKRLRRSFDDSRVEPEGDHAVAIAHCSAPDVFAHQRIAPESGAKQASGRQDAEPELQEGVFVDRQLYV